MSIALMSHVWEARLPPLQKLVLLAIADIADDDGRWQVVNEDGMAAKCSLEIVELRSIISEMVAAGNLLLHDGSQPDMFLDGWYRLHLAPVEVLP